MLDPEIISNIAYTISYIAIAVIVFLAYVSIFVHVSKKRTKENYSAVSKWEIESHVHIAAIIAIIWPLGVPLVLLELLVSSVTKRAVAKIKG